MKKETRKSVVGFLCIIVCLTILGIWSWKTMNDYSNILKENWNISLPKKASFAEVYCDDSGSSFHGDGIRYHVFAYENEKPVETILPWSSKEKETRYYGSYEESIEHWLGEIAVPEEEKPDCEQCVYWYEKDELDEIIICWDKNKDKIYVIESFV